MASKRKETHQKFVRVTNKDPKLAEKVGRNHFIGKGFKIHDSWHAGMHKEEVELEESHFKLGDTVKCKASGMTGKVVVLDKEHGEDDEKYYTVKRSDGKTMKYAPEELTLVEAYQHREQGRYAKPKYKGQTHEKDPHGGGIFAKSKPMKNEEVELDEMKSIKDIAAAAEQRAGSVMKPKTKPVSSTQKSMSDIRAASEKRKMKEDFELEEVESGTLSYKDFVSSLLEYETKDGVYRHKGSYGSSYQGDDDDDEPKKKPVDSTEKRGRGRPAGAKSGARGPLAKK
jgi:hypothetical protein